MGVSSVTNNLPGKSNTWVFTMSFIYSIHHKKASVRKEDKENNFSGIQLCFSKILISLSNMIKMNYSISMGINAWFGARKGKETFHRDYNKH